MILTKPPVKHWKLIENIIFAGAFAYIMYNLLSSYWQGAYGSVNGKGYIGSVLNPISNREYCESALAVMVILNASFVLWEIIALIVQLFKQQKSDGHGFNKYKHIFKQVAVNYKPTFLALLVLELLPKLFFIRMFWIWMPHIQKIGLFTINLKWYSWIYAYLCWEFATWVFHFTSHRVRILWCLHSPHHAPTELNMTVNWVHFFAESYYSTIVHLVISTLLGIQPVMFVTIMSISSVWGVFTHISERTLKNGHLGILKYLLITPAHHRVHHAKNPLYMDTNFATTVPLWDWLFGTLQPLKDEVKVDFGITREPDVTNFGDLYFGEFVLLYHDIKNAGSIKNKLLYIVMPPGWTPACTTQTAAALRRDFLKANPGLDTTSRNRLFAAVRSGSKAYGPKVKAGLT